MTTPLSFMVHFQDRYRIFYTENDSDLLESIAKYLDQGIESIENIFSTHVRILFFNVFLCPSRAVFDRFVQLITRVPTDKGRIGQPQGHDIYMLSPKCYRKDAPFYGRGEAPFYDEEEFKHNLIHELVHVWEELSSPTDVMDTCPVWFSEGLAMYVSESYTEREFKVRLKADYDKGIIPPPDEIKGERNYTWGCILFEFLLSQFGPQKILDVITSNCEENIISLFDTDTESLIRRYLDFAKSRIESISLTT